MVITTSPNVSNFDFTVQLDVSGSTPKAIITDISTYIGSGASAITGINFKLIDPANLYFHDTTYPPDIDIAGGGNIEVNLPLSGNAAKLGVYKIYATLIDEDATEYEWQEDNITYKGINLCKPNTLKNAKGNFGGLELDVNFDCDTQRLIVNNLTSFSYKGKFPSLTETAIVISYPPDSTGTIQTQVAPFVPFVLPFNTSGTYSVSGQVTQTYDLTETTSVKVGYIYSKSFPVQCGYSLCMAWCDYDRLYQEVKSCKNKATPDVQEKQRQLLLIDSLLMSATVFKGCGKSITNILEEIKTIGGFECNCDCTGGFTPIQMFGGTLVKGNMCGDVDAVLTQFGSNVKIDLSDVSYTVAPDPASESFVTVTRVEGSCAVTYLVNVDVCTAIKSCPIARILYDDLTGEYTPNNTSENTVKDYTVAGGTMGTNGDVLKISMCYQNLLAASNTVTMRFKIDGTQYLPVNITGTAGEMFRFEAEIHRKTVTTAFVYAKYIKGVAAAAGDIYHVFVNDVAIDFAADHDYKLTSQLASAVANAVGVNSFTVEYVPKG